MSRAFRVLPLSALLLLGACATVPSGPGVMALPGSGKSFDQFRADDLDCRQYASYQVGGSTPNQVATDSGVNSAAIGALVGAAAGAAIGGSRGAGVGAGTGLAAGALAGTGAAEVPTVCSGATISATSSACTPKDTKSPFPETLPVRIRFRAPPVRRLRRPPGHPRPRPLGHRRRRADCAGTQSATSPPCE